MAHDPTVSLWFTLSGTTLAVARGRLSGSKLTDVQEIFVADAWETDDIDGVVSLLTDDAWYSMPPAPFEYQGSDAIGTFLREYATARGGHRFRLVATRANTQPAFGVYRPDPHRPIADARGLLVLTLAGDQIAAITQFTDTSILPRFGLPRTLPS